MGNPLCCRDALPFAHSHNSHSGGSGSSQALSNSSIQVFPWCLLLPRQKGHLHRNLETSILAPHEKSQPLGHLVPSVVSAHVSMSPSSRSLSSEARVWENAEAVF